MMRTFLCLLLAVALLLLLKCDAKSQHRPNAALSRKKIPKEQSQSQKSIIQQAITSNSFVNRWSRKIKGSFFSSDVESWILELTDPTEEPIDMHTLKVLTDAIQESEGDVEFAMIVLGKLSRKMTESDVFTKFKALLVLHQLITALPAHVSSHLVAVASTLMHERDMRNDRKRYFSTATLSVDDVVQPQTIAQSRFLAALPQYHNYLVGLIKTLNGINTIRATTAKQAVNETRYLELVDEMNEILSSDQDLVKAKLNVFRGKSMLVKQCLKLLKMDQELREKRIKCPVLERQVAAKKGKKDEGSCSVDGNCDAKTVSQSIPEKK